MDDAVEYLKIAGRLHPDNRVQLRNSYVVPDPPTRVVRQSELSATALDGAGTVLGRWFLTMRPYSDDSSTFSIRGTIPLPKSTAVVEIWRDSGRSELIRLIVVTLPDSSPDVSIVDSPVRTAEGRVTVRWEARGEPAPVEYRVHYSHDDGETWLPVSHRLAATEFEVDVEQLPGGRRCRVRVRATNGVRSSEAVSRPFRVAVKACQAIIQQPLDGADIDTEVSLLGNGWYLEEREPELQALRWESDRDGPLGDGRGVLGSLSPGEHRITLTAGTEERAGTASVHITVREPRPSGGPDGEHD